MVPLSRDSRTRKPELGAKVESVGREASLWHHLRFAVVSAIRHKPEAKYYFVLKYCAPIHSQVESTKYIDVDGVREG